MSIEGLNYGALIYVVIFSVGYNLAIREPLPRMIVQTLASTGLAAIVLTLIFWISGR